MTSQIAENTVRAKSRCPDKHRGIVERSMAAYPPPWRVKPQNGEVFDDLTVFEARIRAWSFCEGFDVVEGNRSSVMIHC